MQRLLLAEDVFDKLPDKNVTIRLGRKDIQLGKLEFESLEKKRKRVVTVFNVHYCKFGDIYIGDIINDGFYNHSDLYDGLKRFYPNLTWDSEMTTIKFKCI